MKAIIIVISIFSVFFCGSCNKEEIVNYTNKPTEIQLITPEIQASPGQVISIQAKLVDDLGVKFYTLISSGLTLNKTVNVSTSSKIVDNFDLLYSHTIPANVIGKEYEIIVRVKNLTGQVSESIIKVSIN